MSEDTELEKYVTVPLFVLRRAVEELLRETDRARVRAETMGPAGWLKCPLRGTNKRFLLNTLRSAGLQRRAGEPAPGHSAARGRLSSDTPNRGRDRSRSPPRERRSKGGHADHKNHDRDGGNDKDEREDRDKERRYRHRDNRDRRRGDDGQRRQTS